MLGLTLGVWITTSIGLWGTTPIDASWKFWRISIIFSQEPFVMMLGDVVLEWWLCGLCCGCIRVCCITVRFSLHACFPVFCFMLACILTLTTAALGECKLHMSFIFDIMPFACKFSIHSLEFTSYLMYLIFIFEGRRVIHILILQTCSMPTYKQSRVIHLFSIWSCFYLLQVTGEVSCCWAGGLHTAVSASSFQTVWDQQRIRCCYLTQR